VRGQLLTVHPGAAAYVAGMDRTLAAFRDAAGGVRTALLLGSLVLAACGVALLISQASFSAAAISAAPKPPATITAYPMRRRSGTLQRGRVVRSRELGVRAFPNAQDGFALASISDVTYPAATTDGGKIWRIDGPAFHIPAANAPAVVTLSGAGSPDTYFAFPGPGGGQLVDVTADGGKDWYDASFPGLVMSVIYTQRTLIAFAQVPVTNTTTKFWVYASKDGGRKWTYSTRFGECIIGGCS
jgi:hypothetical protein